MCLKDIKAMLFYSIFGGLNDMVSSESPGLSYPVFISYNISLLLPRCAPESCWKCFGKLDRITKYLKNVWYEKETRDDSFYTPMCLLFC